MTVYVDDPIFPFRSQMYCHMATDGEIQELHVMARRIGLKLSWFQAGNRPHYDLSPNKRALAVKCGAVEIKLRDMIKKCFPKKGSKE